MGKQWKQCQTLFLGTPKSLQIVAAAMELKDTYFLEEKLWSTWIAYSKAETLLCWLRSVKSRLWFFLWSCMDVRFRLLRRLSAEELMLLNCDVGEDYLESLGLQGDPTSPFWRRSTLGFLCKEWCWSWNSSNWPPHAKNWLTGKDSDAGRDWRQEDKGMTEDKMAVCHHWLDGHESEWTLGVGDGQWGLVWCDSWDCKQWDTTEHLNWTEVMFKWLHLLSLIFMHSALLWFRYFSLN